MALDDDGVRGPHRRAEDAMIHAHGSKMRSDRKTIRPGSDDGDVDVRRRTDHYFPCLCQLTRCAEKGLAHSSQLHANAKRAWMSHTSAHHRRGRTEHGQPALGAARPPASQDGRHLGGDDLFEGAGLGVECGRDPGPSRRSWHHMWQDERAAGCVHELGGPSRSDGVGLPGRRAAAPAGPGRRAWRAAEATPAPPASR